MFIQLVRKNEKVSSEIPTCQTSCALFDDITGKCGIYDNEVPSDPLYTASCSHFISDTEWRDYSNEVMKEKSDTLLYLDERSFIIQKDAVWYNSPDGSFDCWILSLNKEKRFMIVDGDIGEQGWHEEVYRSPYPLHNHDFESEEATRVVWLIDEDGYGQYAYIYDNELILSHPKIKLSKN